MLAASVGLMASATTVGGQADAEFTRGPEIAGTDEVLAFLGRLARTSPATRVRIPVLLTLDSARLTVADAHLGPTGGPGALRLRLDDGGLGIALVDRARSLCPPSGRCVVRLVGYWKGGDRSGGHFEVRRVDGLAPEGADRVIETARRTPW
jgi:hypothetical protein